MEINDKTCVNIRQWHPNRVPGGSIWNRAKMDKRWKEEKIVLGDIYDRNAKTSL